MASSQLFKIESVSSKKTTLLRALKHNKRTLQAERGANGNINVTRSHLNYSLTGSQTPEQIDLHAKVQMVTAGIDIQKQRKNAVLAVEVLFSLPIDRHDQDTTQFFSDCYAWVKLNITCELLSFDVHLDEAAPHGHALILPIIDNRLQGDKLKGNRDNITRLINLFYEEVGKQHGLSKGTKARLSATDKQTLVKLILTRLKPDAAMRSIVWDCIRDLIVQHPATFADRLSIELLPATGVKIKSFVDHKRSQGKGSFIR
jgi:hypothetical protein